MGRSLLQFWEKDGQEKAILDENLVITSQFGYRAKFSDVPCPTHVPHFQRVVKRERDFYCVKLCTHVIHCIIRKNYMGRTQVVPKRAASLNLCLFRHRNHVAISKISRFSQNYAKRCKAFSIGHIRSAKAPYACRFRTCHSSQPRWPN